MTTIDRADDLGDQPTVLRDALDRLRLAGAIFFRSELTEPFLFESVPNSYAADLHPGAERLIIFHLVSGGACWVSIGDGERHWAEPGDVIVVPYGDAHAVGGVGAAELTSVYDMLDPMPWDDLPVLRLGGGGEQVDVVCGYLHSEDPLFDPRLRALPDAFVVRPDAATARWVEASIAYAMEENAPSNVSPSQLTTRLPELILVEVLRAHLASAPATDHGWLAALRDPVLAPALARLHGDPARRWTVAGLAGESAVSRSVLDERFRRVLGRSPIRYLTEWRMHLADDLLASSDLGVVAIARRVGYESEEAFSRAFKRERGLSPAHWRLQHRTAPTGI